CCASLCTTYLTIYICVFVALSCLPLLPLLFCFFLFDASLSSEIYTLSLHDALPIYVVTDAASGVVDIFHGIDKAVADTWNSFIKDRKSGSAGMPRPISYAVFCLKKKNTSARWLTRGDQHAHR